MQIFEAVASSPLHPAVVNDMNIVFYGRSKINKRLGTVHPILGRASTLEAIHPQYAYQMILLEITLHSDEKCYQQGRLINTNEAITQLTQLYMVVDLICRGQFKLWRISIR